MEHQPTKSASAILQAFDVHPERGFLPAEDPLRRLPSAYDLWEEIAADRERLLIAGLLRKALHDLPILDVAGLTNERQLSRAMLLLSYFGHAYIWGQAPILDTIPAGIARPWYEVARLLGRPPVLSYASHALYNWRRFDPSAPIAQGNIARLENFLGGVDESWFVLVHIDIEGKAGLALQAIVEAQAAVWEDNAGELERQLAAIAGVLQQMLASLLRMPEKCDPYIYYNRVRPFIFGWKDNPALPNGVRYEGVPAYNGVPQTLRGETGAQSSIIPSIHAALGISYTNDPLRNHLLELRDYMPPKHRQFIEHVEHGPSIREYVLNNRWKLRTLVDGYNACVDGVLQFQTKHLEFAGMYVHAQSQRSSSNPIDIGTGGTPFMVYLKKHRDELDKYMI